MGNFDNYSKYYDLLYCDKDYKSECDYVLDLIGSNDNSVQSILELGCGSGNHALFFTLNGIEVTGIERSKKMVEVARSKKINNFFPIERNIVEFDLNKTFDSVVALFHVMSYLTDNKDMISCLKSVNRHLHSGGLFIFDIWFTPSVYSQKPETRVKKLVDDEISVLRITESASDFKNNVVNVNFEVHIHNKKNNKYEVIHESHPMRHFSIPELELLAVLTGFEMIRTEEFLTKKKPSDSTWGVCIVFKKQ